jgi:hypothetical protein
MNKQIAASVMRIGGPFVPVGLTTDVTASDHEIDVNQLKTTSRQLQNCDKYGSISTSKDQSPQA